MTTESEPIKPSLQACIDKLAQALKLVFDNSKRYSMKPISDVSEKTLKEIDFHFVDLGYMMVTLQKLWMNSRSSGSDALAPSEKLENRIDIKLVQTGRLDLEQFRRIMIRLHRADELSNGLDRIYFHLSHYRSLCAAKGLDDQVRHSTQFMDGVLSQIRSSIRRDAESLQSQINRCNLYNDTLMKKRTFRVAFSSLLVSVLSVLIAVISLTLRGGIDFQVLGFPQILALITSAMLIALLCYLIVQWFEHAEEPKTEPMTTPEDRRAFYSHVSRLYSSSINVLIAIIFGWAAFIGLALNTINGTDFDVRTLPLVSFLAVVIVAIASFSYLRVLHFGRMIYQLERNLGIDVYGNEFKTFRWMSTLVVRRDEKAWSLAEIIALITLILYFACSVGYLAFLVWTRVGVLPTGSFLYPHMTLLVSIVLASGARASGSECRVVRLKKKKSRFLSFSFSTNR